jgi:hypothetical protein
MASQASRVQTLAVVTAIKIKIASTSLMALVLHKMAKLAHILVAHVGT